MAYQIIGETIKSATSLKLGEIFGKDTIRYKETITNVKYPNFFIDQINLQITPAGRTRMQLDYLINIRYRVAEDTASVTDLQQRLDEVGLELCAKLLSLDLERPVKTKNRRYEKVDGVLQFFFEVTVYAVPEETEEPIRQQNLKINREVI